MFRIEWGYLIRRVIEAIEKGRKNKSTFNLNFFSLSRLCITFAVILPADTINFQAQPECLILGEMSSLHLQTCPTSPDWNSLLAGCTLSISIIGLVLGILYNVGKSVFNSLCVACVVKFH